MEIAFDPAKDAENRRKHGISLQRAVDFNLPASQLRGDDREDYGEEWYRAVGFLDAKLYVLIFTIQGNKLRAISLRKANRGESLDYAEKS